MPRLTDEQIDAIESIDKHVLVSAGAGSGKTLVLIERYIKVLEADAQAGIHDIIAVTFTRKAAEEMRSRLKVKLKELAELSEADERRRWLQCLTELEAARIGTIHSLCESILKNYPSEAGIDPGFEILNDLERAELLSESIDQALHLVIEQPHAHFSELLDYPVEDLKKWLSEFLRSPLKYKESRARFADGSLEAVQTFAEELIKEDIKRAVNEILADKQFISDYRYLKDTPWSAPESKLGQLQNEMLSYLHVFADSETRGFCERFQALQSLAAMETAGNSGGKAALELRATMRNLLSTAKATASRHKSEFNEADRQAFCLLRDLIMLTDEALSRYEALKLLHQKLDFDDLIDRCRLLLTGDCIKTPIDHPTLSLRRSSQFALKQLSKNLRAVLVDEFQDTNWTQSKLLTALASAHARLFLIGDDKQSIYKFQGADVGTFNTCKTYVSSMGTDSVPKNSLTAEKFGLPPLSGEGRVMTLSQSFRSHPQIVNFVNHLFRSLFDAGPDAETFKSRFQALRPARSATEGDDCPRIDISYTPYIDDKHKELKSELDQMESQLVADWILGKIESGATILEKEPNKHRPINFSDFAILLQANSDFAIIEQALAQSGVPYVSIAGSGFLDRQEVLDLENILKWLVCPQDSHALFAVLRSPMFGFSDDLLHELKAGKQDSLWRCLVRKSKEEGEEDLRAAVGILQKLLRESGLLALPDLVRRVVLSSGYDLVLLCSGTGKQKSRNVFKFLSLAYQHKYMSVAEFLKSLDAMRELGVKNLTDAPLFADNAVKIMTIHKSKGLEFAAVALPRLGRSVFQKSDKLLFGKDMGIALDCTRDRDEEKPAFFTASNNLSKAMDEEEKKRLFYVALTRAKDYLGLFITPKSRRGTNLAKWLIETLVLPDADTDIESQVMSAGRQDERCSWNIFQAALLTDSRGTGQDLSEAEAITGNDQSGPSRQDTVTGNDRATLSASEQITAGQLADFSLLESPELVQTFAPVPWQALQRVCPTVQDPDVHATIGGNYFHLLMSNLGPDLQLPSEKDRRALLLSHEVAVHDAAQQELLLKESERLLITFKNSSLYPLLKTAKRRIPESAYLIATNGFENELRPDLIIEDSNGVWHIVDYKTDHFEERQLARQVTKHAPQLIRYVEDLETLLSVRARAWIYFAQTGRLEPVDPSSPFQLSLF